jgi:hypothetical protein
MTILVLYLVYFLSLAAAVALVVAEELFAANLAVIVPVGLHFVVGACAGLFSGLPNYTTLQWQLFAVANVLLGAALAVAVVQIWEETDLLAGLGIGLAAVGNAGCVYLRGLGGRK